MKLLNYLSGALLCLVFCFWNNSLQAQCTPDSSITGTGIFPDTLVGTCAGLPYEEVINLIIPPDTIVQGFPATIDSLVLDSVAGLPPGLNFFCLDGSCSIAGGSRSCVQVSGTPTTAGVYPIDLYITGYVVVFGAPVAQPDTLFSFYTLTINPELTTTIGTTNAACGANDGTATVTASGTAPYTYAWSTGATTATVTGLAAGIYTVTTSDANGCELTESVEVQNVGNIPAISVTSSGWVGCSETGSGAIDLTVSGGMAAYTYSWSSGETTEDISGLAGGMYTVTVTDANNCTDTEVINISQPSVMDLAIASQVDLLCAGDNSGVITASLSGGQTPYTTSWDTNPVSSGLSIGNLSGGTYTLTVTDDLGCMKTTSATLTEPSPIVISVADTSETAAGAMNGSATATVSGGTPPYTYSWDNGADSSRIDSLLSGTYILTVTDANNCVVMDTVEVQQWAVGIEDELAAGINSLSIYPNPNQGQFSLDLSLQTPESVVISVFDLRGQKVFEEQTAKGVQFEQLIFLGKASKGMYVLQIQSPRGMAIRKFVIH
ncbi:MAG: T9SS type A sorting domain-containing protein [Bacteroidota bacterium]